LKDELRRDMEVEDSKEEDLGEEAAVKEEFRAIAFPEISSQLNVINLNNIVQEVEPDSNSRIIKLLPIISPENIAT